MMNPFRKFAVSSLLLAWFVVPTIGHAATCTSGLARLHGWYGMLVSGATTGATPVAKYLAGSLFFDGAGNLNANNIYAGGNSDNTATGSYVLNADCTFSITLDVAGSATQAYTVGVRQSSNQAVGIETDSTAVATIDLQAQYTTLTTGLNFTSTSLDGTFAANCLGPLNASSDLNLVTFAGGALSGTDPFNNGGNFAGSNVPYSGTYKINSDGTFGGVVVVEGTTFDFFGVISRANNKVEYFYTDDASGTPTDAFSSCTGGKVSASATLTPQTITFNAVPTQVVGTPLTLGATASSGLAVSYNSTTTTVCTVSGATATFLTPGTCSIVASQAGNATYAAATSVTQSFTVNGVSAGTFSLSAQSSGITAIPPSCFFFICFPAQNAYDSISVRPSGGFAGTVNLSVTGLPSGVTASFSPTSINGSGSSTLQLVPSSSAAFGQVTVITVNGSSNGQPTASVSIQLFY